MKPILQIQNLSIKLGEHPVLENVSFEAFENQFVAIIGPNGAGKTVFMKTLLGLIKPSEGSMTLWGEPLAQNISPIGYVPQTKTLSRHFPALASELVLSGLKGVWPFRISKDEKKLVAQHLEQVGAAHLIERPLTALSGGELQRIYLARALIRNPRLVLLDEPATGIDTVGESDMYSLLEDYRKRIKAVIIMSTHDLEVASHHADSVLLLNQKQICFGPAKEVLTKENLYRAFGHDTHVHH